MGLMDYIISSKFWLHVAIGWLAPSNVPFRFNSFEVIVKFVNFNQRAAAILDLLIFRHWSKNLFSITEVKFRLKFRGNRLHIYRVIQICLKTRWRRHSPVILYSELFAPRALLLEAKFGQDSPFKKATSILVSL